MIPPSGRQPALSHLGADDEFPGRNDPYVLGRVAMWLDARSGGIRRKKDVAAPRGEASGVEGPIESRERKDALGECQHRDTLHGPTVPRLNEAAISQEDAGGERKRIAEDPAKVSRIREPGGVRRSGNALGVSERLDRTQ